MNQTLVESACSMITPAACRIIEQFLGWSDLCSFPCEKPLSQISPKRENCNEWWHGRKPDVSHFRVFRCMAYTNIPACERRKLGMKSRKMHFVGYSLRSKGHFDETNRKLFMYIWRDVELTKSDFSQKSARTTKPDQKSVEEKQNADITAKDEEKVAQIRRIEKDRELQEPQYEKELWRSDRTCKIPVRLVTMNMQTLWPAACVMLLSSTSKWGRWALNHTRSKVEWSCHSMESGYGCRVLFSDWEQDLEVGWITPQVRKL